MFPVKLEIVHHRGHHKMCSVTLLQHGSVSISVTPTIVKDSLDTEWRHNKPMSDIISSCYVITEHCGSWRTKERTAHDQTAEESSIFEMFSDANSPFVKGIFDMCSHSVITWLQDWCSQVSINIKFSYTCVLSIVHKHRMKLLWWRLSQELH